MLAVPLSAQVVLWEESFENATTSITGDSSAQFYQNQNTLFSLETGDLNGQAGSYTGYAGTNFFSAEQTAYSGNAGGDGLAEKYLTFAPIDTSGYTDLSFSGLFASNAYDNKKGEFDQYDGMAVFYSVDEGASWNSALAFTSTSANGGNLALSSGSLLGLGDSATKNSNALSQLGTGQGLTLNSAFQRVTVTLGDAASIQFRILVSGNDKGEGMAFDDFTMSGTAIMSVPEPSTYALVLSAFAALVFVTRRRIRSTRTR